MLKCKSPLTLSFTPLFVLMLGAFTLSAPAHSKPSVSSSAHQRAELLRKYPGLADSQLAQRAENPKILCPFHRLIERAGIYDSHRSKGSDENSLFISIQKIAQIAQDFGCSLLNCGGAATAASTGQLLTHSTEAGYVNLLQLHRAVGAAHDCGFTFALGGSAVSEKTRQNTLAILKTFADEKGRVGLEDLNMLKTLRCKIQGATLTIPDQIEVDLIYTFLGGSERGYVDYDDVVRLFYAELPRTLGSPGLAF